MSASDSVMAAVVAPSIGVVVNNFMFLAHLPAVRGAVRAKKLGHVNADPYPMCAACALSWVLYGATQQDAFVIGGNLAGANLSLYYSMVAYLLTDAEAVRCRIERVLLGQLWVLSALGFSAVFFDVAAVIGIVANILTFIMFGAPLSQIRRIVQEQDSSSIDRRFMVMQIMNCTLWLIYGLATGDLMLLPPNGVGLLLGLIQVAAVCRYPIRQPSAGQRGQDLEVGAGHLSAGKDLEVRDEPGAASGPSTAELVKGASPCVLADREAVQLVASVLGSTLTPNTSVGDGLSLAAPNSTPSGPSEMGSSETGESHII